MKPRNKVTEILGEKKIVGNVDFKLLVYLMKFSRILKGTKNRTNS